MGFTGYAAFVAALMNISITGVKRVYGHPPTQLNTSDMPCMYPALPEGSNGVAALSGGSDLDSAQCEMVIVVEPLRQNLPLSNFNGCLALMDAANTAIKAQTTAIGIDNWAMRMEQDSIGDTAYWMLIIAVEGSG